MLQKRWFVWLSALVLVSVLLSSCGQAPPAVQTAAPIIQTVIVGGTPQTIVVTATPPPATAEPEAQMKDTIIIGSWQEPGGFLDYANNQAIRVEVELLYRPRWVQRRNFEFQPNPALIDGDLPTFENGGAELVDVTVQPGDAIFDLDQKVVISATEETQAKQLVVTGKIKSGLKWSDGEPLTAKDFILAWRLNCSDDSGAIDLTYCPLGSTAGAGGLVSNYEATDDTTLVLSLAPNALDPLYQLLVFGPFGTPQPSHLFEDVSGADLVADERAQGGAEELPVGYGPYNITEWVKGDHINFEANPNWAGEPPKTPKVVYRFFSDSVALASAVIAGDIDASSGTTGVSIDQYPYLSSVAKNEDIVLEVDKNAASFEMLYLNFNDPKDTTLQSPHPVLSDFNVRKAIAMALDRKQMVDTIFFGQSSVVEQPHLPQMMSYDATKGTIAFDLEAAKSLMEEAGWTDSDGDGVREKDGVRAAITVLTTSGNTLRQKSTQIIQSNLKDLGIEVTLDYKPSSVTFSQDGLYGRAFDAIEFANVFSVVDPGNWWYGLAACSQIPTPDNGYAGSNFAGWCDEEASDAVTNAAFLTLDREERIADWNLALEKYFENGYPLIPLFIRPSVLAYVPELSGPALDSTEYNTWNIETWTLQER